MKIRQKCSGALDGSIVILQQQQVPKNIQIYLDVVASCISIFQERL